MNKTYKTKIGWVIELKQGHTCRHTGHEFYCGGAGDHIVASAWDTYGYAGPFSVASVFRTRASARRHLSSLGDEIVRRVILNSEKRPMVINGRA